MDLLSLQDGALHRRVDFDQLAIYCHHQPVSHYRQRVSFTSS